MVAGTDTDCMGVVRTVGGNGPADLSRSSRGPQPGLAALCRLWLVEAVRCAGQPTAPVPLLRKFRLLVLDTVACLLASSSRKPTRIEGWRRARPSPWRVVVPVGLAAARCVDVERAQGPVADRGADVQTANIHLALACVVPERTHAAAAIVTGAIVGVAAARDRAAGHAVAGRAAYRAARAKEEAGLPQGAREPGIVLAAAVGDRTRARLAGLWSRVWMIKPSAPRREGSVDGVPRARQNDSAVAGDITHEHKQQRRQRDPAGDATEHVEAPAWPGRSSARQRSSSSSTSVRGCNLPNFAGMESIRRIERVATELPTARRKCVDRLRTANYNRPIQMVPAVLLVAA